MLSLNLDCWLASGGGREGRRIGSRVGEGNFSSSEQAWHDQVSRLSPVRRARSHWEIPQRSSELRLAEVRQLRHQECSGKTRMARLLALTLKLPSGQGRWEQDCYSRERVDGISGMPRPRTGAPGTSISRRRSPRVTIPRLEQPMSLSILSLREASSLTVESPDLMLHWCRALRQSNPLRPACSA